MSIVERYHEQPRRADRIIRKQTPSMDDESTFQATVEFVNNTTWPKRPKLASLVPGAMLRLGLLPDLPAAGPFAKALAVANVTKDVSRNFSNRQVQDALCSQNGPIVSDMHKVPSGVHVLVNHIHCDKWDVPYPLFNPNGKICMILAEDDPKDFRLTVVKPFYYPSTNSNPVANENPSQHSQPSPPQYNPHTAASPAPSRSSLLVLFKNVSKQRPFLM